MRIVITTTLNDNLFHAKLIPLLRARPDVELVIVTDRKGPVYERVKWVWPRASSKFFGRLGGRLLLLLREVMNPRTKIVMAYNVIPHGMFASAVARLRGLPVFIHLIGGQGEIDFVKERLASDNRMVAKARDPQKLQDAAQKVTLRAAKIFVPGTNTANYVASLGYDKSKIVHLHSTIDPTKYFASDIPKEFDVIVSASLRERKRPFFTLGVFRAVLDKLPSAKFCWLGNGPLNSEFQEQIAKLNLQNAVTWLPDANVADFYRRARVFLLCSVSEGLSLACMEAMACGCVPVTTDCGDMSDIVGSSRAGILLPVKSTQSDFAKSIQELLADEARFSRESIKAREIINSAHSFNSAIAKWREILAEY